MLAGMVLSVMMLTWGGLSYAEQKVSKTVEKDSCKVEIYCEDWPDWSSGTSPMIVRPDPSMDYKMLYAIPDPSVDYKTLPPTSSDLLRRHRSGKRLPHFGPFGRKGPGLRPPGSGYLKLDLGFQISDPLLPTPPPQDLAPSERPVPLSAKGDSMQSTSPDSMEQGRMDLGKGQPRIEPPEVP